MQGVGHTLLSISYRDDVVKSQFDPDHPTLQRVTVIVEYSACALYLRYNTSLIYNLPLASTLPPSSTTCPPAMWLPALEHK